MKLIIENLVPILLGVLVSGIGATIKMMIATRRDVKELLKINFLQTANIGAITSCAELHLKANALDCVLCWGSIARRIK